MIRDVRFSDDQAMKTSTEKELRELVLEMTEFAEIEEFLNITNRRWMKRKKSSKSETMSYL